MLRAVETSKRTDTGRQRTGNEDAAYARAPLFVVADGMGGAQAGEVASQTAVEVFERGLASEGGPEERLVAAAQDANRRIYELSRGRKELAGMGTTLTAGLLDDDELLLAHVGDSRAYLFRQGALRQLTQDHTLVGALVREGKLTEDQAAEHPQRSIITRALGPEPWVEVDTWSYRLVAGDVVLLCSDGLTSMISEEQITALLQSIPSLDAAAEGLIAAANAAGGRDNITVVAFRVEDAGEDRLEAEQPTLVGVPAALDEIEAAHPSARPSEAGSGIATVSPPAPSVRSAPAPAPHDREPGDGRRHLPGHRARLARTQGPGSSWTRPGTGRERPFPRLVPALITIVIVLGFIGAGGWLATRQLFFLGTNAQGAITLYRGLPYDLPAGIKLYESLYVSGVGAATIPVSQRVKLLDHHLRSESDASSLVRDLELGRLQAVPK